jgi:predicted DNA-binding transcriptional regulator AlpA
MWPTFEIYLSIMSGLWLPSTSGLMHSARLHRLLLPGAGCQADAFFMELLPFLDPPCQPAIARLRREVMNLAQHSRIADSCCDGAFLRLPSPGYRQQFCHLLIGFTLAGYDRWMNMIVTSAQGEHCRLYFRRRMMEKLESLIELNIWPVESPYREPQIVYLVKTVLCILYTRLEVDGCQSLPGFCARERLQWLLSESGLEEVACSRLMSLYNRLTGQSAPSPLIMPEPAEGSVFKTTADNDLRQPAITEAELAIMLSELKSNFEEMKRGLESAFNGIVPAAGKKLYEPNQMLDAREVQEMLGVSKATMNRYRKKGLLPYTQVVGKYRYDEEDVKNVIRNKRI